jgi:hypothetical protein
MLAAERMARGHVENLVHSVAMSLLQLSAGKVPPIAVLVQFTSAVEIPAFEKQRISEAVQP